MNKRQGAAFLVAVLVGSPLGLFLSISLFGSGGGLRDNDFLSGMIMLGCMLATGWLVYKILEDFK
jgi:hypothetical protein